MKNVRVIEEAPNTSTTEETGIQVITVIEPTSVIAVGDGPPGPQGPPGSAADAMSSLIYDPRGIQTDVFDAGNLTGVIDGGVFT